jgi:hypothetical protein
MVALFPRLIQPPNTRGMQRQVFGIYFYDIVPNVLLERILSIFQMDWGGVVHYHDENVICATLYEYQLGYFCGYMSEFVSYSIVIDENDLERNIQRMRQYLVVTRQYNHTVDDDYLERLKVTIEGLEYSRQNRRVIYQDNNPSVVNAEITQDEGFYDSNSISDHGR